MFPTNFKWQESIFEEYMSQGSSGIYDNLWHSVCLELFPSSSIPSDKTPELCCPLFNNAIYASAAINNYYSYTLLPQSPLPPPPHRCYMMIVREEPPLPPPPPTQPPRKKALLLLRPLACRWIYLSIFVRRGHNAARCRANYITDLLTAGWKW